MLTNVRESKMRTVRVVLTIGWLLLIVSLFWDPLTPQLTQPTNVASPFHLQGKAVLVQGEALAEAPYAMTNRIWWTMIIPLLPLFFMVAGHEAWRRICPLSFVSQIPRYLGLNRRRAVLVRKTGQIEKKLALVSKDGWWRKNVWYIQFGLLFLALNARILFVNSDRTALGLFFVGVIVAALTVGYLWGGKTWCNYICPIAIVQKIYTEPRGLLESQAHITRQSVSQSMCRTSTPEGDRSICVGCTVNCPDIDLERSYWESIEDPALRHVYYGFYGLVVGFYCFYYFYAGNWDYYFSGAWTHEADQLGAVLKPGMFIGGMAIGIPKLLSAPLILASFVAAAVLVGKGLEAAFRYVVKRFSWPLTEPEIISRCLSFSAYLSINTFYLFGGRPNLMLFPNPVLRFVDIAIVALSTLWFFQAIQRNPTRYRREGLASSLMEQLRKLKIDISKYLEGRKLEELKPDEIYVLAKTLPSFSREQRLQAYRNILEEALRTGRADNSASLELLREVRVEIGVTDDEHRQLLQDLGIDGSSALLDPERAATFENFVRVDNYRRVVEPLLVTQMDIGKGIGNATESRELSDTITKYREIYQITEVEHANVIASITGTGGLVFERAQRQLHALAENSALVFGLRCQMLADPHWLAIGELLIATTVRHSSSICSKLFSILLTLGNTEEAKAIAAQIADLTGEDIEAPLAMPVSTSAWVRWDESLDGAMVNILRGAVGGSSTALSLPTSSHFRSVIDRGQQLSANLTRLVFGDDLIVAALALTAISYLDLGMARQFASQLGRHETTGHWLLTEVTDGLLGKVNVTKGTASNQGFAVTVASPNSGNQTLTFDKDYVTVGRSAGNDIVILGQAISPYHLAIGRDGETVEVRKTDPFSVVFLNGRLIEMTGTRIESGARISFVPTPQPGPQLLVEWSQNSIDYSTELHDTVTRLLWLSRATIFREIELGSLIEIASSAEIRRYAQGAWLCKAGDPTHAAFLLQTGTADVVIERGGVEETVGTLGDGSVIGELGVVTGRPRAASVRITSSVARILTIDGDRLRRLMERNSSVSMSMLSVVAGYVKT